MTKAELVAAMAEDTGLTEKQAEAALESFMDLVRTEVCAGREVKLVGWGKFERKDRAARQGRNPRTGEPVEIPAKRAAVCKLTFDVPQKPAKKAKK